MSFAFNNIYHYQEMIRNSILYIKEPRSQHNDEMLHRATYLNVKAFIGFKVFLCDSDIAKKLWRQ